ncbi:MAG TPA: ABC transporter permease [Vicinamibacterales bacterium]|nr:ABC transporter permease [Vicinamibacterales bacterium]
MTFENVIHDLRYAMRQLRRAPGFAAAVALSLALGVGANTAIFTLIDAVLLRMLPIADPGGLQFVRPRQANGTTRGLQYAEFRKLRAADGALADVAAYAPVRLNVSIDGSVEPAAEGQLVSGTYFQLLGVGAHAGRTLAPSDDTTPGAHPAAMISYAYWKRRFGLDPSTIGRTVHLSQTPFTIVGVTPREFFGLEVGTAPDLYVPLLMQPAVMPAAENWLVESIATTFWLSPIARVKPAFTVQQAAAQIAALDVLDPLVTKPSKPGEQPQVIPERLTLSSAATGVSSLRHQFSQPLAILMAVVVLVLLIACANVATLVLARAAARGSEFAMRLALGAGRGRLVRQLLVENIVLAVIGGACGLLLARWACGLLVAFMSAGRTPIALDLQPDGRILAFTAAVSIGTGVLCGLVPAIRAAKADVLAGLADHARGQIGGAFGGRRWVAPGKILVSAQVVLCLLLLASAGLFVRTLRALDGRDDGVARDNLLVVRVEPRGSDQRGIAGTSERLDRTYRDLLERIRALPGVTSASFAHYAPTAPATYAAPLRTPSGTQQSIPRMMAYPNYFATMNLPVRAGRDFTSADLDSSAPLVGIVNEAFVTHVMRGDSPIGRRFAERDGGMREIIAVVRNSRYASLKDETTPLVYQPFLQTRTGRGQMTLHVRVASPTADVIARVRAEIQSVDRAMPLFTIETLAAQLNNALGRERLVAALSIVFGGLALLLASVGVYGLMAFSVVQRTSELGLRMALGAAPPAVRRMIMRDALVLVGAGLAIGMPLAWIAGRLAGSQLAGLLYGVSATDPVALVSAALLLSAISAIAAYLPAARAARVDPMIALRKD